MKDEGGRMRDERASAGASYFDEQAVKQRIRATAWWAGVAAALLLYFGYQTFFLTGDHAAARIGATVLEYALKAGGWAMVVATVWLAIGMRQALLYDAVATALVGAAFFVGGGLLFVGSMSITAVLYVIFGVIFIGSGRRSWQEHQLLRAPSGVEPGWRQAVASPTGQDARAEQAPDAPTDSLASRLRQRTQQAPQEPPPSSPPLPESAPPPTPEPPPPAPEPPREPKADTTSKADPAPDGFLAQFADEHDERNREG